MSKWVIGVGIAAAAAYAIKWRRNYVKNQELLALLPPEDIAGPVDLTDEELLAFEDIDEKSCFGPCCVDTDEMDALFLYPDADDTD